MDYEFQYNPDTWDPTVRFIDSVTGKPPKDLVKDVGYKTVKKMPSCDFESVMQINIQGG